MSTNNLQAPLNEDAPKQEEQQVKTYARVKMPAAFLRPYTFTAKDGQKFDKAYVRFPQGTKVNGINLSGYSCDVFLSDYMIQQMLADKQVTLSFNEEEKVSVWTGNKDDPQHPYKRFEVNAWTLVKGIKSALETFKAEKASEREAEKENTTGLKAEAEEAREASVALTNNGNGEKNPVR